MLFHQNLFSQNGVSYALEITNYFQPHISVIQALRYNFFFNLQFKRKDDVQLLQNLYLLFCSNLINSFLKFTLFKLSVHFNKCPVCIFTAIYKYTLKVLVVQSCPILCDPMDQSPPSSSVHGVLQARILEWVAIPSSRGASRPERRTRVSCTETDSLPLSHH